MASSQQQLAFAIRAVNEASATLKTVQKDIEGVSKTAETASGSTSKLGGALGRVGEIASGFIAANVIAGAAQRITGFIGDSITAASDLGESLNAVNKIFGTQTQTILDWGKANATSFGLSQREFNQMATPLGAALKNSGMAMEDVSKNTIDLTKRAADMASVFNEDVGTVLTAIQAALRGEADPIERFGVGMSAAKVEAKALALAGKTVAASLTDQEKATARLALLFEQTETTAGDFAGTSKELANATRIATARQEEMQAQLGTKLLPVMLKVTEIKMKLVDAIIKHVIPALDSFSVWIEQHRPEIEAAFLKIKGAAEAFAKAFVDGVSLIMKHKELLVVAIAAIGAAIVLSLGPVSLAIVAVVAVITIVGKLRDAFGDKALLGAIAAVGLAIAVAFGPAGAAFVAVAAIGVAIGVIATKINDVNRAADAAKSAAHLAAEGGYVDTSNLGYAPAPYDIPLPPGYSPYGPPAPLPNYAWELEGMAMGGAVRAGRPYMVGERGPELFLSQQSGRIVPNHALGGGNTYNYITVPIAGSVLHTESEIDEAVRESWNRLNRRGEL